MGGPKPVWANERPVESSQGLLGRGLASGLQTSSWAAPCRSPRDSGLALRLKSAGGGAATTRFRASTSSSPRYSLSFMFAYADLSQFASSWDSLFEVPAQVPRVSGSHCGEGRCSAAPGPVQLLLFTATPTTHLPCLTMGSPRAGTLPNALWDPSGQPSRMHVLETCRRR